MKNSSVNLTDCVNCSYKIFDRLGTICPKCGYTIGYFNGDTKRKEYAKLFALNVFAPFISFITILFTQISIYSFIIGTIFAIFLAYKSAPIRFKSIFSNSFEKWFFYFIWFFVNLFLLILVINILYKSF